MLPAADTDLRQSQSSGPPPGFLKQAMRWTAVIVGLSMASALQLRHFPAFYSDDSFISLRYSARLLQGYGLTWNGMHPVEGYSNLLWVLACAGIGATGITLPTASLCLGVICSILAITAVFCRSFRRFDPQVRKQAVVLGCGSLLLSGPFMLWTISGLEQPMLAALLAWATYLALSWMTQPTGKASFWLSLLLGFISLVRADGAIFTCAFVAAAAFVDRDPALTLRNRTSIIIIPALLVLFQLLFRRSYYGEWLPNTAYVKVAFTPQRILRGVKYDVHSILPEMTFYLLAIVGLAAMWKRGACREVLTLVVPTLIWSTYITFIGGDIFPYGRHFIPVLVILAFAIPECCLLEHYRRRISPRASIVWLILALGAISTSDIFFKPDDLVPRGRSVALFLKDAFSEKQPLISADAAGAVPFYTNFPAIDPLGLNDYHIARHKTPLFGKGILGHEVADGAYVLDQQPDLLLFSGPYSAILLDSDQQIASDPRFATEYQIVRFDTSLTPATRCNMYVRRFGGKVGVQYKGDQIFIPPYLASMSLENSVRLINGQVTLVLPPRASASFDNIRIDPGLFTLHLRGNNDASIIAVDAYSNTPLNSIESSGKAISFKLRNETNRYAMITGVDLIRR